jgi:uncharacterized membrane protein YcjF (UPF0283 family)
MKKINITLVALLLSMASFAQDNQEIFDPFKDRQFVFDILNISAVLLVVYGIASFILQIIKNSLDFKLKNRILEKQAPSDIISQLLQPNRKEGREIVMQWFFVLAGIGVGLTLVNLFKPFGLHSLAILAFSVSAGFLGYYLFGKKKDTPSNS